MHKHLLCIIIFFLSIYNIGYSQPWTCFDVFSNKQDFSPAPEVCSPRQLFWTVKFRVPSEDVGAAINKYRISYFWDFNNDLTNVTTVNAVYIPINGFDQGGYEATGTYTYPKDGVSCTYNLVARLNIAGGGGLCGNSNARLTQSIVVWDNISNNFIGNQETDHNPGSAGNEVGETVEICRGDDAIIILDDNSEFNCINDEPTPANQNLEARWVQWVYGTANDVNTGGIGAPNVEKIAINGIYYDDSEFPVFGEPEYYGPNVTNPTSNSSTLDIQMPREGTIAGQRFIVTMRSWNICNPFDNDVTDGNGLNPSQVPMTYDIYSPASTAPGNGLPTPKRVDGGAGSYYANTNPEDPVVGVTVRTFDIVIVDIPEILTVTPSVICTGDLIPILTAGNVEGGAVSINWYDKNPKTDPTAILLSQNNPAIPSFNPALFGSTSAGPNIYSYWVTQQTGGALSCESDPIEITLTVREDLSEPTINYGGANPVCADIGSITLSSPIAAATETPGGATEFLWTESSAGISINGGINDQQTVTIDIDNSTSGPKTIQLLRRYVGAPLCTSPVATFILNVDAPVTAGTIGNAQILCTGDDPAIISNTLSATDGNGFYTYLWQHADVFAGPYLTAPGTNDELTYDPPVLTNTKFYRRLVFSGVCSPGSAVSNVIEVTMNQVVDPGVIDNPQNLCFGDDPAVLTETTAVSGGDGVTFNILWQESTTGGGVGFVAASGTNNLATYDPPVLSSTMYYRRRVTSGLCPIAFSNEIEITVDPLPTASVSGGGSVCSGTAAPDIVWTLTGTPPYNFTINRPVAAGLTINETNYGSNTYTIAAPLISGNYEMTSLTDNNGCVATVLGGVANVAVVTTAPPDIESFTASAAVCDDGALTTVPELTLDLMPNSVQDYSINYNINGGPSINIPSINSTAAGIITITPDYITDLGQTPGIYTFQITSIVNNLTLCNANNLPSSADVIINPRPADPTGAVAAIACSFPNNGATISVAAPTDPTVIIRWYRDNPPTIDAVANGFGSVSGGQNENFTPDASETFTYYAIAESTTVPTNCQSLGVIAVVHTQDIDPTQADADITTAAVAGDSDITCDDFYVLNSNAVNAGNNETGTWSVGIPIYSETFSSKDNLLGITGPANPPNTLSTPNWSIDITNGSFADGNDFFRVENGAFTAQDTDNDLAGQFVEWRSLNVDISTFTGGVDLFVDASQSNVLGDDGIEILYSLNSGALTQFSTNPTGVAGFADFTASETGLVGNNVQIIIRIELAGNGQFISFDNVSIIPSGDILPKFDDANVNNTTVRDLPIGTTTLTWTIESELGVCAPKTSSIDITRNALPPALDPAPQICADLGSTDGSIDPAFLITLNNLVNNSTGHTVQYFSNPARNPGDEISTSLIISSGDEIFTRVTRTDVTPNCTQDGVVTFQVNSLPNAVNHIYEVCEETPTSANKDNNNLPVLFNDIVTGITGSTDRTVDWYTDPGGVVNGPADLQPGDLLTAASAADVDAVTDATLFYALITNTDAAFSTSCQSVASVEFNILASPNPNPISGQSSVCVSNSIVIYQLTNIIPGSTYAWNLPPDNPGFIERAFGGGVNDFFVGIRFPGLTTLPNDDLYNIEVLETSPAASGSCVSAINTFAINVTGSPAPNPIDGPAQVCKNQSSVVYEVQNPNPANTYSWSITSGDASIVGAAAGVGRTQIVVDFRIDNSSTIEVVETSPTGCSLPGAQVLVVNAIDVPVINSPDNFTMCSGEAPNSAPTPLNFTATPGGNTFNWTLVNMPASVTGGVVIDTEGDIDQTLVNTSGLSQVVVYEVVARSTATPFCEGPTQTVFITVEPQPVIAPNQSATICSGENANFDVLLSPLGLPNGVEYSWSAPQVSDLSTQGTSGSNVPESDPVTINDSFVNASNSPITATYTITPTVAGGLNCTTLPAVDVIITIDPEPVQSNLTDNECSDVVIGTLLPAADDDGGAITSYDVTAAVDTDLTGTATTGNGTADVNFIAGDIFTNLTNVGQNVVYTVKPYFGTCAGTDFIITVTIDPEPLQSNLTDNECSDVAIGTLLPATDNDGGTITSYEVSAALGAGLTGTATVTTGTPITNVNFIANDIFRNVQNTAIDVVYTVTPYFGACEGADFDITVTIDPEPVQSNLTDNGCSDALIGTLLPAADDDGGLITSYDVVAVVDADLAGTASTVTGTTNVNFIAGDIFTNLTNAGQDVVYTVTPYFGTCSGTDFTMTVTIDPEPVQSNLTDNGCSDVLIGTLLPAADDDGGAITTYDVTAAVDSDLAGTATIGNGTADVNFIAGDVFTNLTNAGQDVVYTVTPYFGTCVGSDFTITVTIDPEPVMDPALATFVVCSDEILNLTLATNGTSVVADRYDINLISQSGNVIGAPTTGTDLAANALATNSFNNVSATSGTVVYQVIPKSSAGNGDCTGDAFNITVTVNPEPVMDPALATLTICSDEALNLILNTNGTSIVADRYDINLISQSGNLTGTPTTGTDLPANVLVINSFNNVSATPGTMVYEVIPRSSAGNGDCIGDAFNIIVTVNPEPVMDPALATLTVCSDEALNLTLATNGASIVANRYDINLISQSGNLIGAPTTGTDLAANALATNSFNNVSATSGTVVYEVIPKSSAANGDCTGDAFNITVTVNPEPVMDPALANLTVCSDEALNLTLNTNGTSISADRYDINLISQSGNLTGTPTAGADLVANALLANNFNNVSNAAGTVVYQITPKSAVGDGDCTGNPFNITVTVNPEPVVNPTLATLTVCSDEDLNLTLNTNATSIGADRYDINLISQDTYVTGTPVTGVNLSANALSANSFNNVNNIPGTVVYEVIPRSSIVDGDCIGNPFIITVTVNPEPEMDPALATLTVCSDEALNLTLNTNGTSIGANRYDINLISQSGNLTGTPTTGANLTANALLTNNFNNVSNSVGTVVYEVIPRSAVGDGDCIGNPFNITVRVNPEPVMDPALATLTVCSDEVLNLTLSTISSSIGANRYDVNLISQSTNVINTPTTGSDLLANALIGDSFTNVSNASGTVVYQVIPKSSPGNGDCTGNPFTITVTVNPEPVIDPALATLIVCSDEDLNLTLATIGSSIGADRYDISIISQDGNLSGFATTGNNLISTALTTNRFNNVSNTPGAVVYQVIPKSSVGNGDCTGDAFNITVTVNPEPVIDPALAALRVCSDEALNLTLATNGSSIVADRYDISLISQDVNVTGTAVTGTDLAANALALNSFNNVSNVPGIVIYDVVPKSSLPDGDCAGNPFSITVTVDPEPVIDPALASLIVCSDEAINLTLQTNGTSVGADRYDIILISQGLNISGTPTTGGNLGSNALFGNIFNNVSNTSGDVVYEVTPKSAIASGDCIGNPFLITVTVNPEPVIDPALATLTVCSDEAFNLILTTNGASIGADRYDISLINQTTNVTGTAINGTNLPANVLVTNTFNNVSSVAGTVVYEVIPKSSAANGDCSGDAFTVTVTVNPEPVMNPSLATLSVCSDEALNLTLGTNGSSINADRYDIILINQDANVTGTATIGSNLNANALAANNFNNVSSSPGQVTYRVTPKSAVTSGDCTGNAFNITVTVNPEPVINPSLATRTVCSDEALNLVLTTNGASINADRFDISFISQDVFVTGTPTTGINLASNALITNSFNNVSNVPGTVVYEVIPKSPIASGDCLGNPFIITVTVNPESVIDPALATLTVCSDEALNLTLATNGSSIAADRYDITLISQDGNITGAATTGTNQPANALFNNSFNNVSNSLGRVVFEVIPKSSVGDGNCTGDAFRITVTVDPEPVQDDLTDVVCSDVVIGTLLPATDDDLGLITGYEVSALVDPDLTGVPSITTGTPIGNVNFIASDIYTNLTNISQDVVYTVIPYFGTCAGSPFEITVTIDPEPVGTTEFAFNSPVCSQEEFRYNIQIDNLNTNNGINSFFSYSVTSSNPGITTNTGGPVSDYDRPVESVSDITDIFINNTGLSGIIEYEITPKSIISLGNCLGDPFTVSVVINSDPIGQDAARPAVCSDEAFVVDPSENINGLAGATSYNWVRDVVPPGLTIIAGPSTGSGNIVSTIRNRPNIAPAVPLEVEYVVTPISEDGCEGDTYRITVPILPEPVGITDIVDVCGGGSTGNYSLQGQISNGVISDFYYTVSSTDPTNVPPAPSRLQSAASSDPINNSYSNSTGSTVIITYDVTPVDNVTGCEGDSFLVQFNIIPGPLGVADSYTYCSGDQLSYNIQDDNVNGGGNGVDGNYTYTVESMPPVISTAGLDRTFASNDLIEDSFVNTTGSNVIIRYTVTPESAVGACIGTDFIVDFVIKPVPQGTDDNILAICSGDTFSYDLSQNVIDTQFANNSSVGLSTEFTYTVSTNPAGVLTNFAGTPINISSLNRSVFTDADINVVTDEFINRSATAVTVTYTVMPREDQTVDPAERCSGQPFEVSFQILPEPVIDPSLAGPLTVCSDEITNVILATNGTSVGAANYTITVNSNGLLQSSGTNSAGASKSSNEIENDAWNNMTNSSVNVEYTVTPFSSAGCAGEPLLVTVEVLPEPVFELPVAPVPACSNETINVVFGSTFGLADNFQIVNVNPAIGLSAISATLSGNGGVNLIANDRWENTNTTPLNVDYTIQPFSAGCAGDPFTFAVVINPAPNLRNLDATVCSGELSGILLDVEITSAPAVQFRIVSVTPDPALGVITQTNNGITTADVTEISADAYTNNTNNPLTVAYRIIPIEGSPINCEGPEELVTLTIEPTPTMLVPADEFICTNDKTSIVLNSNTIPTSGNVTFDVQAVPLGAITGAPFLRQNLNNGFTIDDELRNLGNTTAEIQYEITPKIQSAKNGLGCSAGAPIIVSVFVEPEPKGKFDQLFVSICEGESIGSVDNFVTSNVIPASGNIEFEVTNAFASDPAVTGFNVGTVLTTAAPNNEITDIINIADGVGITTEQTVTYQLTPRLVGTDAGTCVGEPNSIEMIITVRPKGVVTPSFTNIELCNGESFQNPLSIDLAAGSAIASWTVVDNPNIEGEFDGLGSNMFLNLINTSITPQTLEYIITPQSLFDSNCVGIPVSVFVTVNPNPDIMVVEPEVLRCDGDQAGILLDGNVAGTRFEWTTQVLSGSVDFGTGGTSGTGNNGDVIDHVLSNTGTTSAIIRYSIEAYYDKTILTGNDPCEAFIPGFVTLTLSPPVSASIVPHSVDGTGTRIRCVGNVEAVRFELNGAAPFTLTYNETDANGTTITKTESSIPSQYAILASESVTYELVQVEDANGCIATSNESVQIIFEEAVADFEVRGADAQNTFGFTDQNSTVNLDFDSGTGTVEFRINNFDAANSYVLQIADEVINVTSSVFQYTFTEPSNFGTLGFVVELQVSTPNVGDICNDVKSFFIEVIPADPVVLAVADILEACPPFNVNFESFREDLSLSKNVLVENLTWRIDGITIQTPNPTYTFTQPGTYNVEVTGDNGYGKQATAVVVIRAYPVPSSEFIITQNTVYIPDEGFRPTNRSQGTNEYLWDFGDFNTSTARSPEHFYEVEGDYEVTLTTSNDFGCTNTKIDTVNVQEGGFTKTPNAFTPGLSGPTGGVEIDPNSPASGDLANDVFLPITIGVEDFKMWIYDRWGNLIFYSDNKRVGWDGYDSQGNLLPSGVYVYKLDLILSSGQRTTRVGDVTLIR